MATTNLTAERSARLRADLKHFLQSRRAGVSPADVGLPSGGRRRTPGLRREEVAVLAGVGVSWYTWLEQGRDIKVSDSVLDAICGALLLDEQERVHLYRLAGLNPPPPVTPVNTAVTAEFERLVEGWMPNPAYMIDRHWNVLLTNHAARTVFGFTDADRNCLVSFFSNASYRSRHRYWDEIAPTLVSEFRRDAARFPNDHGFDELADQLCEASPSFAALWARHDVVGGSVSTKAIDHPRAGAMIFELSVLQLPAYQDIRLMLHTPQTQTDTARKLAELMAREVRKEVVTLVDAG